MQSKAFNQQFSERLREIMIQRGYTSPNSASGVRPSAICKAIDCFSEMAVRYLDGRSIPTPENILKLAEWLQVEPGYLLFGDVERISDHSTIKLNKDLFEYALEKTFYLANKTNKKAELLKFFISILSDLASLEETTLDQLKKIFDMSLQSSMPFIVDEPKTGTYHGR